MENRNGLFCDKCRKLLEEAFSKGEFCGNKNTKEYCEECYEKVHKEPFYKKENTDDNI